MMSDRDISDRLRGLMDKAPDFTRLRVQVPWWSFNFISSANLNMFAISRKKGNLVALKS